MYRTNCVPNLYIPVKVLKKMKCLRVLSNETVKHAVQRELQIDAANVKELLVASGAELEAAKLKEQPENETVEV